MSTQIEVSIIIPTYNLEKYIGATLESVILQDGITKEVLVIDDFSTDKTRNIVQTYATKYPYIKLLQNERTKGVSGARNTGIAHMQGKSCFFLDGDDLLPANALKPLFQLMNEKKAPLVFGSLALVCHQRWIYFKQKVVEKQNDTEFPTGTFAQYLYNSADIKNNAILFPEDCLAGEDRTFFCHVFALLPINMTIPMLNHCVYIYRINHKKTLQTAKHALSFARHFIYVREFLERNNKMQFYSSYIKLQFVNEWLGRAYHAQESDETMREYLELCAKILAGMKDELYTNLKSDLKENSDAFWESCYTVDTSTMLEILKKTHKFKPISLFIGIDNKQISSSAWKFIKLLHSLKNIIKTPSGIKKLLYLYRLDKKSKAFLNL